MWIYVNQETAPNNPLPGNTVGLMGVLADSVLEAGGRVVGVIPEGLLAKEVAHRGLSGCGLAVRVRLVPLGPSW